MPRIASGRRQKNATWEAGLDRLLTRRVDARRQKANGTMDPFRFHVEQRGDAVRLPIGKPRAWLAERVEQQVARALDNGSRPFHSVARRL